MMKKNEYIDKLYVQLCDVIKSYHPYDSNILIKKAYEISRNAHEGQYRKSGEPFIIHPLKVAIILAELCLDKETIAAALLHDVIEDTSVSRNEIEELFGKEIVFLVDGVTKVEAIEKEYSKSELKKESFRKLILAMGKDVRVIIIKLADRLHNMRTLQFQNISKQKEIAEETLELYAPIAHKLGISILSNELEDLALMYLFAQEYSDIQGEIERTYCKRRQKWDDIVYMTKGYLHSKGINALVEPRMKHLFSIYRKICWTNKSFDIENMYDIYSIKVIVNSIEDCYLVLGYIHQIYKPVPGRFKDYISVPKSNMYQSLHTTVVSRYGEKFEVQIRTKEMERTSERGVLAFWKYESKEEDKNGLVLQEQKSTWLEQVLEWQLEITNTNDFMDLVKNDLDLFSKEICCFTRSGDVKRLPKGATAIDFAFAIHSELGECLQEVLVNGKKQEPQYVLRDGDQIEIKASSEAQMISPVWLDYVKTSNAKSKIKRWMKRRNQ